MIAVLEALLEASVRVIVVAAAVGLVLGVARVRNGAVLHAAWTSVLCAMLLMPVLPHCVPAVAVRVPVPVPVEIAPEFPPTPDLPVVRPTAVRPATAIPEIPTLPPKPAAVWPLVLLLVYAIGLAAMLGRMLAGWRSARQLVHESATVVELSGDGRVYESALLVTPLTVSVLNPRITLPATWRDWSADKLAAVLAHERAHVRRRDPLVHFLAHVNRCVLWFNPLAWWLERKLAATSELACDEAGIRAVGESRKYAGFARSGRHREAQRRTRLLARRGHRRSGSAGRPH